MNNIVATLRGKMERRDGWNTSTTRIRPGPILAGNINTKTHK